MVANQPVNSDTAFPLCSPCSQTKTSTTGWNFLYCAQQLAIVARPETAEKALQTVMAVKGEGLGLVSAYAHVGGLV